MMCEGAKDSVQVVVLCCALYSSGSLQWGAKGLFIVISWRCTLNCQFKFTLERKQEGSLERVFKSLCGVKGSMERVFK